MLESGIHSVATSQSPAIDLNAETPDIKHAANIDQSPQALKITPAPDGEPEKVYLKDYKPPANSLVDHAINRYLEVKGLDKKAFLPRLGLGVGKLISGFVQRRVAGPDYKPSDIKVSED